MRGLDRLARAGLDVAARRWPRDVSGRLRGEWAAELAAIRDDPGRSRPARAYRMIAFAGSLAFSPPVEAEGAEPAGCRDRLLPAAAGAGLLLAAAAACNAVHLADRRTAASAMFALVAAVLTAAVLGHRGRGRPVPTTVWSGVAMVAFLMAGNRVPVMPFMGWPDVVPGVVVWTAMTAAAVAIARRRRVLGVLAGVAALEAAAVAGSVHAALVLRAGLVTAPAWFPLALLPGGTATFGPYFPDGHAAFGALQDTGPAFHASQILLGNASAMVGPMLLCSVFVLAMAVRRAPFGDAGPGPDRHVPLGVAATVTVLAAAEWLRRSSDGVESTLLRLIDNSNVFGFGFFAGAPGRIAVALLAGVLVGHLAAGRRAGRAG